MSGEATFAGVVRQVPASRRRALLVLVPAVLVALAAAASYLDGGARLSGSGGSVEAPVTVGEEFHTMVLLDTDDGTIELVSARAVGVSPHVQVDVSLVVLGDAPSIGSARGPLDDRYRVVDLAGNRLRTAGPDDGEVVLDVRLTPTAEGIHTMRAVAVTYRAGSLRERTAVLPVPVCLSASADWTAAPQVPCPVPGIDLP